MDVNARSEHRLNVDGTISQRCMDLNSFQSSLVDETKLTDHDGLYVY